MMADWERVVVPHVFLLISSKLSQRDVCALASVNRFTRRLLLSHHPIWKVLDLHGMNRAGGRLATAINLPQFKNVEEINLEFAQGLEDDDLRCLGKRELRSLNLNACQKITDLGLMVVARSCPGLKHFSIYWNLKITDAGVKVLLENCEGLTSLNLSGCKRVTDKSLEMISVQGTCLTELNLTRCLNLTDDGLSRLLESCRSIQVLYLYAVSSLTDKSYAKLAHLKDLRVLDLCGAQHLTDDGICQGLSKCKDLESLNLTWCVKVTDKGIRAIAENSDMLQLLSLHGLLGVTDEGLKSLSLSSSASLTTIDVNGCANIKKRSQADLLKLFPRKKIWKLSLSLSPRGYSNI
ncbi:hypothetical protein GOP47_0025529 [Adiantum capillus-veneris]|uniref:F-box/LRR-repeat protein 15-like leucin rich repeat domain-containing protein n=1 Tax=Adiantum capillus-veneris TaxID=13818 RepID=A0A9D4U0R1_ADICA|nr:hypothetical protein GOP47_0025529 [Adiantum capillus-veneris]